MSAHQNICVKNAKRKWGGKMAGVEKGGWGRKWADGGLKNWLEKGEGGGEEKAEAWRWRLVVIK